MQVQHPNRKLESKRQRKVGHNQHFRDLQRRPEIKKESNRHEDGAVAGINIQNHNDHFRNLQGKGRTVIHKEQTEGRDGTVAEVFYEITSPQKRCHTSYYPDYMMGPKLKSKKKRKGCKNKERREDNMRTVELKKLAEQILQWEMCDSTSD